MSPAASCITKHRAAGNRSASRANSDLELRGAALNCLSESDLFERFYCWEGLSGARYVCTVFPVGEDAPIGDFADGVVIGVARSGNGKRPVCVRPSRDFLKLDVGGLRDWAEARGVIEWHVHFAADYREICRDLALTS